MNMKTILLFLAFIITSCTNHQPTVERPFHLHYNGHVIRAATLQCDYNLTLAIDAKVCQHQTGWCQTYNVYPVPIPCRTLKANQ